MNGVTPEMARAELERRQAAAQSSPMPQITPEQARAELERRAGANNTNASRETIGDMLKGMITQISPQGFREHAANSAVSLKNLFSKGNTIPASFTKDFSEGQKNVLRVGDALWQTAPYIVAGEAMGLANAPRFVSAAAENLPKAAKYLTNLAGVAGKNALFGAGAGAAQSAMEGDFKGAPQNALQGAGIGAVLGPVANVAGDAISALRPSNLLRKFPGTATPEEAKVAAEMAGNLPIGLGKILKSPALDELEKTVNRIPLSGGIKRAEQVEQAAENETEKMLSLLRGGKDENDMARLIQEGIAKNAQGHKDKATELYDTFLNSAKENNLVITSTPETQATAKKLLEEYKTAQTPLDDKMVKKLEELSAPEMRPNYVTGQEIKPKQIDEMHNQIKAYKKAARTTKDEYLASTYNDLAQAMRKDLHATALDSKNPEITSRLSVADKHYHENVVPYKQRDIQNILGGKANLENIGNTLTQSKDHIEKVLSDLPDNLKKSAAYLKFKSAIKETESGKYSSEPQKLFNAYNKLSPVQKDKLFSKAEQKDWQRLGFLARSAKDKGKSSQYLKAAEVGIPMYEALGHANLLGAAKILGTGGLLGLGARGIGNALTSPSMRQAVLNPASNALNTSMLQGGLIGNAVQPQAPQTIDFQMPPANSLNNIDADLINNQIMESQ